MERSWRNTAAWRVNSKGNPKKIARAKLFSPRLADIRNSRSLQSRLNEERRKHKQAPSNDVVREELLTEDGFLDDLMDVDAAWLSDVVLDGPVSSALLPISDTESDFEERVSRPVIAPLAEGSARPKVRYPLPELLQTQRDEAAEPEFFWKLAVESNLLLPVNQENREQNAFWLADWLAQAPDWQLLLIMFKDLYHLADRKSVLLVLSRLVELTSKDQAERSEQLEAEGYIILEKALLKKYMFMTPKMQAECLSCLADLHGPRFYRSGHEASDTPVFNVLLDATHLDVQRWTMHEASLVAHAMAKMAVRDVRLLREVAEVVSSVGYRNMAPLDVWRTARAFSYLFYATPPKEEPLRPSRDRMCQVLANAIKSKVTAYKPRRLIQLVSYLLAMRHHDRELIATATSDLKAGSSYYSASDVVNFLLGYSRGFIRNRADLPMVKAAERILLGIYRGRGLQLSTQILANTAFALAALGYDSPEILQRISDLSTDNISTITTAEIVNIAHAFARLGFQPGSDFLDSFNQHVITNRSEYMSDCAANALWCFALFGATDQAAFEVLIQQMRESRMTDIDQVQLSQVYMAVSIALLDRNERSQHELRSLVTEPTLLYLSNQQKKMTEKVTTSQLQKDVSNRLRALGIGHLEEFRPAHGLFSIDIAFKRGLPDGSTQQIALEVDGPLHFTWNTLKPVFGTVNRNRLLESHGWEVWTIPFFEYRRCANDAAKFEYLAMRLSEMGIHIDPQHVKAVSGAAKGRQAVHVATLTRRLAGAKPGLSDQGRSTRMTRRSAALKGLRDAKTS